MQQDPHVHHFNTVLLQAKKHKPMQKPFLQTAAEVFSHIEPSARLSNPCMCEPNGLAMLLQSTLSC